MLPPSTLTDPVREQAQAWGFVVKANPQAVWQVCAPWEPQWMLEYSQAQEHWVLVARGVPQIRFTPAEAIAFLARHQQIARPPVNTRKS
ncbi:MAG: hypothetical protein KME18_28090 [Phormidium tanganyikae FI6-MK23]|jgi:hypothetical protein|nr:hypothetical protein [Phormidium tanganyikae FI6-MK23]